MVRSAMLETLGEDYVMTARAKGFPQRKVVSRHALRNAMLPTTTLIALSLGYIVAGAILIETVYSWPGSGAVYQAVTQRDYPMLQGAFLILTLSVVVLNFVGGPPVLQARPEDHGVAHGHSTGQVAARTGPKFRLPRGGGLGLAGHQARAVRRGGGRRPPVLHPGRAPRPLDRAVQRARADRRGVLPAIVHHPWGATTAGSTWCRC